MNILLCNDDGYDAPGLAALYEVAREFGDPVVVACRQAHSLKSHAITPNADISIEKRTDRILGTTYIVDGSPADCVRLGLRYLPLGSIDLVLSGINRGANVGIEVYYSGTVAAAREAAILNTPAIAVSQFLRYQASDNWQRAEQLARQALHELLGGTDISGLCGLTNVNLPDPAEGDTTKGIKRCPLELGALPMQFEPAPRGGDCEPSARYVGRYHDRPAATGSDVHYLRNDWITITPLLLDATDHQRITKHHPRP